MSCGAADPAPVAFGPPGPDGLAAAERAVVVLGGCVEWGDDPDRRCRACSHHWARPVPGYDAPLDEVEALADRLQVGEADVPSPQ